MVPPEWKIFTTQEDDVEMTFPRRAEASEIRCQRGVGATWRDAAKEICRRMSAAFLENDRGGLGVHARLTDGIPSSNVGYFSVWVSGSQIGGQGAACTAAGFGFGLVDPAVSRGVGIDTTQSQ